MRRLLLIFFWTALIGQKSPTVPKNVFRFSIEKNYSVSKWDLDKQNFDLQGIGRHYFDNITHNDSVRFSSDYDLYHNGSFLLDSSITIEEWMTNFNISNGTDLPVFEAIILDTASAVSVLGEILESREKTINRKKYQIEYGMSDDITLNIIEQYNSYGIYSFYLLPPFFKNGQRDYGLAQKVISSLTSH